MLHDPTPTKKTPFTLFQREGTRNWSMRYSFRGRQYKKTLGYDLRSAVVHGDAPANKQTFIDLADRSRTICQKILKLAAGIP